MATKRPFLQRLLHPLGEISALRDYASQWLNLQGFLVPYTLDSSRVDYDLAQRLYRNIDDRYKLGAWAARPVVDCTAGFMGLPSFHHEDPEANAVLDQLMQRWSGRLLRINRNTLRDGDCWVRVNYAPGRFDGTPRFDLQLIPPQWVQPVPDPVTGRYREVVIQWPAQDVSETGFRRDFGITERVTADAITTQYDGRAPAGLKSSTAPNPWGFIPIVHFRNEAEDSMVFGTSDLEPIEPFMRAYHDVMLQAIQGSKLFSRPKVVFSLKDTAKFISDNFSPEEVASGVLNFQGKELFLMQNGDTASFVTADQGLAGIATLLQLIFMCIVDVSETPEFAFGTALPSSKASASEQMIPFTRKIRRKRGQFEDSYLELGQMVLAMWQKTTARRLSTLDLSIQWEEISPRDEAQVAATVAQISHGLAEGVASGFISPQSASEFLRQYVPSIQDWEAERQRIGAPSPRG